MPFFDNSQNNPTDITVLLDTSMVTKIVKTFAEF